MKPEENPFRPPVDTSFYEAQASSASLLWRKGNLLVMHKRAELPNRCIKTNEPVTRRLKRNLTWHPSWVYLTLLLNLIVYIIIALILTQRATIHVGLSDQWFAKRRWVIITGWTLVLAAFAMPFVLVPLFHLDDSLGLILLAAFSLFLFGAVYGFVRARLVTPKRMNDDYIWLKGVCPEFLAELPAWPNNP